ncbi:MAG: Bax inhibitor-1/YccA family protein [Saprospiraceae bacterium]
MARFDRFKKSSNPFLKDGTLAKVATEERTLDGGMIRRSGTAVEGRMTKEGAVNKSLLLGLILLVGAVIGFWYANPVIIFGGAIVGLILVVIMSFKQNLSPTLAPVYAAVEGLFVGGISGYYALAAFPGIIFQAVALTMAVFFLMLFLYKSGAIKVTQKLRAGVMMATGAVLVVYVLSFALSFVGISIPYLHEGGMIGIGISLLIVGIAAMNLLLDFEKGEEYGLPAYMEWFCAVGLIVTLVWLYLEILRLLALLSSSD